MLATRLEHGVFGYSRWNHDDFKGAVSDWFASRYGASLDPETLVYGPSVIYTIAQLVSLWSKPGEGGLVHTPAYDAFGNMLSANDRVLLPCPLRKEQGSYQIDWACFEQQAARPDCRILLLCSPHNPIGRVWTRDELGRMAAICQRHGVKVISDDIHMDVSFARYLPWSEVAEDESWERVSSSFKSFNIPRPWRRLRLYRQRRGEGRLSAAVQGGPWPLIAAHSQGAGPYQRISERRSLARCPEKLSARPPRPCGGAAQRGFPHHRLSGARGNLSRLD